MIDDVYQITGLSDIMRGSSEAAETATAQNLKAQYGSIRVRNRQEEMQRLALDNTKIVAEIMAEHFDGQTLLEMAQMKDLPTREQVQQQVMQAQIQAQGNPQAAPQLQELQNTVTIDAVMEMLQNQRLRPFMLQIETDSTIQPDEMAEKQARTEFLQVIGGFAQQAMPMVQAFPQSAPLVAEMLKFTAQGFRAGRDLDQAIDAFGDQLEQMAQAPQQEQPDPAAAEAQAKLQMMQQEAQAKQQMAAAEAQRKAQESAQALQQAEQKMGAELALKREQMALDAEMQREKMRLDHDLAMERLRMEMAVKADAAQRDAEIKANAVRRDQPSTGEA